MGSFKWWFLSIITLLSFTNASTQLYLQIEEINKPESIKIPIGATIIFKATSVSDQWQKGLIKNILYESNTVVFDHTFLNLDKIEKVKIRNSAGEAFGWALKGFGFSWLVMGAIGDLANVGPVTNLDAQNIIIGAVALGTGHFIDKLSGDRTYSNGRTHRFRLIDLRFKVEDQ